MGLAKMVQVGPEGQKEYDKGVEGGDPQEKLDSISRGTSWWQWFEATPYYIGSDELRVWGLDMELWKEV